MENIYANVVCRVLTEAQNNPDNAISFLEVCEILQEERGRVLIQDQADMHDIGFDAVDLP